MSDDLRTVLRGRLATAMKERDAVATRALRTTIAAIDNAEAPTARPIELAGVAIERSPRGIGVTEVERALLTADDIREVIDVEISERLAAARSYSRVDHMEHARQLRAEAAVLQVVLSDLVQ